MLVPPSHDASIPSLVSRAIADAKAYARAEVALVKARVGDRVTAYRGAAIFFVAAAVIALCALIAMLVGLILSLATLIGPGLATLAVTLGAFAIAGLLAWIGQRRLSPGRG